MKVRWINYALLFLLVFQSLADAKRARVVYITNPLFRPERLEMTKRGTTFTATLNAAELWSDRIQYRIAPYKALIIWPKHRDTKEKTLAEFNVFMKTTIVPAQMIELQWMKPNKNVIGVLSGHYHDSETLIDAIKSMAKGAWSDSV